MIKKSSVAVIGAGSVGSTIAYSLLLGKTASTILLVDIDEERVRGQVLDLSDASFLSDTEVKAGTFKEAGQCDIIVITAGAKQRPGETRLDLIERNYKILSSCITNMQPLCKEAIMMLVANPVDILTHFAQKLSGLPPSRVFGTGTFLDTARLRNFLGLTFNIAETAIHAYVVGEHGDSQVVAWSSANVSTIPLLDLLEENFDKKACEKAVREKAYDIIKAKGSTYFGIAGCVRSLCESILLDTNQVRPLSHYLEEYGICLSMPVVIGRNGIVRTLKPSLNEEEQATLNHSAEAMKEVISRYV